MLIKEMVTKNSHQKWLLKIVTKNKFKKSEKEVKKKEMKL